MSDLLLTEKVFEKITVYKQQPVAGDMGAGCYPIQLAILRDYEFPKDDLAWNTVKELLGDNDWFEFQDGSKCLVLGEARVAANNRYYPHPAYESKVCLYWTKFYRDIQKAEKEKLRKLKALRDGQSTLQEINEKIYKEHMEARRKDEQRQLEEQKRESPSGVSRRVAALEKTVEELRQELVAFKIELGVKV
jgi:hypothetical protein